MDTGHHCPTDTEGLQLWEHQKTAWSRWLVRVALVGPGDPEVEGKTQSRAPLRVACSLGALFPPRGLHPQECRVPAHVVLCISYLAADVERRGDLAK